ncbi:unnamed protein product [Trichogramma brassicae]|uniref:Uncharacterized protein n=1 Tax=Trichogramma brassicae TaxID=86971 RepID=A0A6H5J2M3_9HYME|nr:unnamed protein product [Trichogramma brassicae]
MQFRSSRCYCCFPPARRVRHYKRRYCYCCCCMGKCVTSSMLPMYMCIYKQRLYTTTHTCSYYNDLSRSAYRYDMSSQARTQARGFDCEPSSQVRSSVGPDVYRRRRRASRALHDRCMAHEASFDVRIDCRSYFVDKTRRVAAADTRGFAAGRGGGCRPGEREVPTSIYLLYVHQRRGGTLWSCLTRLIQRYRVVHVSVSTEVNFRRRRERDSRHISVTVDLCLARYRSVRLHL